MQPIVRCLPSTPPVLMETRLGESDWLVPPGVEKGFIASAVSGTFCPWPTPLELRLEKFSPSSRTTESVSGNHCWSGGTTQPVPGEGAAPLSPMVTWIW